MSWTVADVTTRDVVTVEPSTPFNACVRMMRLHGVGALPVMAGGKVKGIVSMLDPCSRVIARACARDMTARVHRMERMRA